MRDSRTGTDVLALGGAIIAFCVSDQVYRAIGIRTARYRFLRLLPSEKAMPFRWQTTGGMDTVAVRMPNHPVWILSDTQKRMSDRLALSANTSGRPSPTESFSCCIEDLSGRIAMILDGRRLVSRIESTIIDLTDAHRRAPAAAACMICLGDKAFRTQL